MAAKAGALLRSPEGGPEQPSRREEPRIASEAAGGGAAFGACGAAQRGAQQQISPTRGLPVGVDVSTMTL